MAVRWAVGDHSPASALGGLVYFFFLCGGLGFITFLLLKFFSEATNPASIDVEDSHQGSRSDEENASGIAENFPHDDVEHTFHIESIRAIATEFFEVGISFFGCYGLEVNQEGVSDLVGRVFDVTPPGHYASKDRWKEAVRKNTYNMFISLTSQAINHENAEEFDLDSLLLVFPGIGEELTENYVLRIQNATAIALGRLGFAEVAVEG
jgi:hypothetical protein